MENELAALSNELAAAVEQAGRAVVAVNARPRFASSGVLWRPGVIVTAEHTIRRRDEIGITLPDGRSTSATLSGRDPGTDLAVLKLAENGTPTATFGATETLEPRPDRAGHRPLARLRSQRHHGYHERGQRAVALAAWWPDRPIPAPRPHALSGQRRRRRGGYFGRVLGIATSALSRIAGLAVPASTVNRVVDELLRSGQASRGYLGLGLHPVALPDGNTGLIVLSAEPVDLPRAPASSSATFWWRWPARACATPTTSNPRSTASPSASPLRRASCAAGRSSN